MRPIIRGKLVESGAKLCVSLSGDGVACVDNFRWDAFHEGGVLKTQLKVYRTRRGYYPQVLDNPVYGTRENRRYLKECGIRLAGKPLGRPRKVTEANREALKRLKSQRREDYLQRISIEFGQGKNGYHLNIFGRSGPTRPLRRSTASSW